MTNKGEKIDVIHRALAISKFELESKSKQGLTDDDKYWEDIICGVLNICYGFNLANLNHEKKNFPGIDLGNDITGLGIQVTIDKSSGKIKDTLIKITDNKVYEKYKSLKIFILGKKQISYSISGVDWKQYVDFDVCKDILDFSDVENRCQNLSSKKLEELISFLEQEVMLRLDIGSIMKNETKSKIKRYTQYLKETNSKINIVGVGQLLPIEKAWIRLQLSSSEQLDKWRVEQSDRDTMLATYYEYSRNRDKTYDIESILESNKNTVILAGPGMGKSTLCKKLINIAIRREKSVAFAKLLDIASYIKEGGTFVSSLAKAIAGNSMCRFENGEIEQEIDYLILDGLDECGDIRKNVANEICSWSIGHSSIRVIVTSRPVGYDSVTLQEYTHMEIQSLAEDELSNYAGSIFNELAPDKIEECKQWFEKQLEGNKVKSVACRSPLLLGLLIQLSIRFQEFGKYRVILYRQIVDEWLKGSSRQNTKCLGDAEMVRGIEMIAFYMLNCVDDMCRGAYNKSNIAKSVGREFERELGCKALIGCQKAEGCLEFWTERGILDKTYYKNEERYLFLHLNIGEYLAAVHISKFDTDKKEKWISENYRKSIWHEPIRMAIACDDGIEIANKLLIIENEDEMPVGSIFLAAEGLSEKKIGIEAQNIYDRLLDYIQSDNPTLSKYAYDAIHEIKEGELDWRKDKLLSMMQSDFKWVKYNSYGVYICMPQKDIYKDILQEFIVNYSKHDLDDIQVKDDVESWHINLYGYLLNQLIEETIELLDVNDVSKEVIETLKKIYNSGQCSLNTMGIVGKYLEKVGEGSWKKECDKILFHNKWDINFLNINKGMAQSERCLVKAIGDIFGRIEHDDVIYVCIEYSKITKAICLMESPIYEFARLAKDLEKPYSRSILKAVCIAAGADVEMLRKEIYFLEKTLDAADKLLIHDQRRDIEIECDWEKAAQDLTSEELIYGLTSSSDLLGIATVKLAATVPDKAGLREGIIKLLECSKEDVIYRVGLIMPYVLKEQSLNIMIDRIVNDKLTLYGCLYNALGRCYGEFKNKNWMVAVRKGLYNADAVVVKEILKYLNVELNNDWVDEAEKKIILEVVKKQFYKWDNTELICPSCDGEIILSKSGFCPKCHVGGKLPFKEFTKILCQFDIFSEEELIVYGQHENSDISQEAKEGLKLKIINDNRLIGKYLFGLDQKTTPQYIFSLILNLQSYLLENYKHNILEIANGKERSLVLTFIRNITKQTWLTDDERKKYLQDMLQSEDINIRGEAMKKWLGK